jgi:hypothetical protein
VSSDAQIPSEFGCSIYLPTNGFVCTLWTDLGSSVISFDALSVAIDHAAACGTSLLNYTSFFAPSTTKPSCLMNSQPRIASVVESPFTTRIGLVFVLPKIVISAST